MWLRVAMGRWTKKQNFNLQPQFKKIKVKVTIERNITLSLHLVHSIEKTSSYILLVFGEGDVIGFSQWGLILFILFFQQLTPRILFVNMFSFLWSVLEEEGHFIISHFLELVSVFLARIDFRFPCGIFLPKVCRIWNLWWIIISTLHIAWFCWIQSKISQKRKYFTFCLHRQNCPIISVIGMIRDGELSSKAMRKIPW